MKIFCLLTLVVLCAALPADRYRWAQPWTPPANQLPPEYAHSLYLLPVDWLHGRPNLGYQYQFPSSACVSVGLWLQSGSLAALVLENLGVPGLQRAHVGGGMEVGVGYTWSGRVTGIRTELSLAGGYVQLHPSVSVPMGGVRATVGYQFKVAGLLIQPFWSAHLAVALTAHGDATSLLTLWSGKIFFAPTLPGINDDQHFSIHEDIASIIALNVGVKLGLPLAKPLL